MSSKTFDKICLICGDRASGYHFNVITCESCKSFFRRNALKNKNFRCYLGGDCQIDVCSRTFCKKCRLKKCFDSGMKTEYILSDQQKWLRKSIIEENKIRKLKNTNQREDCLLNYSKTKTSIDVLNCETNSSNDSELNNYNPKFENNFEEILVYIERPVTDYNKTFNELEGNHLTELFNAIRYMSNPSATFSYPIINFWDAIHVLHLKLDIDIRKLVKMSKSLNGFRAMSENDQIVLLKFASIEIIIIRMILQFDFQLEYWNITTNSFNSNLIKLELLKDRPRNCYENHKHFLQNIGPEWDSDPVIIDLLTVVLLFNPNRPKLNNRNVVKLQQQIYMHLLKRYLLVKYQSEIESELKFSKLINSLTDLHILNEKIRLNCLELNLQEIPLVKEICDRDGINV